MNTADDILLLSTNTSYSHKCVRPDLWATQIYLTPSSIPGVNINKIRGLSSLQVDPNTHTGMT